jgi:hypothetical protein
MTVKPKTVCPSKLELDGKAKKQYAPRHLNMTVKQKTVCPSTLEHDGKAKSSMPLDTST